MHWSVQVQVSNFFPSLDGIYWITLTHILHTLYILPFENSDFSDCRHYCTAVYYLLLLTYTMRLDYDFLAAHLLHFAFLHHQNESNEATIVSCPHPKNTYHFLLFSLFLSLCHLVVYLAFIYLLHTSIV